MAAAAAKGVDAGKTLALGPIGDGLARAIHTLCLHLLCHMLGAVGDGGRRRFFLVRALTRKRTSWSGPTSDHTRTGLNAATDMTHRSSVRPRGPR